MFSKKAKPQAAPKPDVMKALTLREVSAHAGLEHNARHLAIKGEPGKGYVGLTPPEGETVDLIERRIAERGSEFEAHVTALAQEFDQIAPNPDHSEPHLQQRMVDGIANLYAGRSASIQQALAAERTTRAERAAFRDEHQIAKPARYPRSRLVHFRWLLAIIVVETLLEASFLLPATPDGLVGAAALALGIAALTTSLGLAIGFGPLRYMAAPGATRKSTGTLALPLLGGLLLFVCLYVAHYRHLAGLAGDAPGDAQVIEHMLAQPLDLSSQGILLFLLSLGCALFAVWKGYTASDPIPGYEAVDRAHADARDDLEYLRGDLRGGVTAIRTSIVAPLLAQPRIARIKSDHLRGKFSELQAKRNRIAALNRQEIALAQRAIAGFRKLNLATRADGITPDYFSEAVVITGEEPVLPAALESRLEVKSAEAVTNAARAAEIGLHLGKMLDRTSDRTDDIMASIDRGPSLQEQNAVIALRASLESTLAIPSLPAPAPEATQA